MKKLSKNEDSTLLSIIGIVAVASVVAVAMYLSFRTKPGDEEKKNRYASIRKARRR